MSELLDQTSRGTFPPHWGEPPTPYDSPERRDWIAENARREGSSKRALSPRQRLVYVLGRVEDPSVARERARIATRNRLRQEDLMRRNCP